MICSRCGYQNDKPIKEVVNNSECGKYTRYSWNVKDNSTGEEFEVISGKHYSGAFVCTKRNFDTYSKRKIS